MRKLLDSFWNSLNSAYQNQKTRRYLFFVILLVSIGFIALALITNWNEFSSQEINFDYRYIILAVIIYPAGMLPTAFSWHTLLRTIGIMPVSYTHLTLPTILLV